MRLIIARHGETDESLKGNVRTPDESKSDKLNQRGILQACALAEYLKLHEQISIIYTSPLQRSVQTANILANHLEIDFEVVDCLNEVKIAELAGQSHEKRLKLWELIIKQWQTDPNFRLPGGESLAGASNRVTSCLKQIARNHPYETVVVIGHQGALAFSLAQLLNSDFRQWGKFQTASCAVTILEFNDNVVLRLFNQREHLSEIGTSTWLAY